MVFIIQNILSMHAIRMCLRTYSLLWLRWSVHKRSLLLMQGNQVYFWDNIWYKFAQTNWIDWYHWYLKSNNVDLQSMHKLDRHMPISLENRESLNIFGSFALHQHSGKFHQIYSGLEEVFMSGTLKHLMYNISTFDSENPWIKQEY